MYAVMAVLRSGNYNVLIDNREPFRKHNVFGCVLAFIIVMALSTLQVKARSSSYIVSKPHNKTLYNMNFISKINNKNKVNAKWVQ